MDELAARRMAPKIGLVTVVTPAARSNAKTRPGMANDHASAGRTLPSSACTRPCCTGRSLARTRQEGDRDDQQAALVRGGDPGVAIFVAVAVHAVLHDHHRLVGRVRRRAMAFQHQRPVGIERVGVGNAGGAAGREGLGKLVRCHGVVSCRRGVGVRLSVRLCDRHGNLHVAVRCYSSNIARNATSVRVSVLPPTVPRRRTSRCLSKRTQVIAQYQAVLAQETRNGPGRLPVVIGATVDGAQRSPFQ